MTTPDLAPDEKTCPFCAETIKAAAIRCRFCGSDLPPVESVEPEESGTEESGTEESGTEDTVVLEPEPVADQPGRRSVPGGLRLVAALAVLCVLLAGLLAFLVDRSRHPDMGTAPNGQVTQASFRNAVLGAASDAAAQALSYSYKTFDADREKSRALMGPTLAKQYDDAMSKVEAQTAEAKLTLKATVLSAGLLSAKEHEAKVLLFVNTLTTREGSKKQQLDQNRVLMTLTRKDGGWTVSKMDAF